MSVHLEYRGGGSGFELVAADGRPVAAFHRKSFRERGEISTGGAALQFTKQGGRRFDLVAPDGAVLATARKPGLFSRRWTVSSGTGEHELTPRGIFSSGFEISGGGRITRRGLLGRRGDVDLPDGMPAELQCFVVALAITLWRRDAAAAGAAGGASAAAASG